MYFKNKLLAILLTGIVSFSCVGMNVHATEATAPGTEPGIFAESDALPGWPSGPAVNAEAAVVMEAKTGAVLYSKNADAKHYPASITKILTTLVALESSTLDEVVTFSRNAVYSIERDSSHIARTDGEELTMEQCLYAVMLESANECANAVAEHIAGSVEAFAEVMNAKARQIGCTGSNFVNPHGLHNENHYITARDMALITREALKNDMFRTIAGTVRYKIPPTNKNDEELTMNHHHSMLSKHRTSKYFDESVFAGKNGYTTNSLNTLVTCANRNGLELIVVVLRCPSGTPYTDTDALLDYAEQNFTKCPLPGLISDLPQDIQVNISDCISGFDPSRTFLDENSCSYAVVPNGIAVDALTPTVTSVEKEDDAITATVSYSYHDVPVGSCSWYTAIEETPVTDPEAGVSENVESDTEESDSSGTLRKVLRTTLMVTGLLIVLLLVVVFLLIIRARRIRARRRRRNGKRRRPASRSRHSSSRSSRSSGSRSRSGSRRPASYDDFDDFDF